MGKNKSLLVGVILFLAMTVSFVCAVHASDESGATPPKVETIGPFEVVTHTTRFRSGWNTGDLGVGTTENYSLRYGSRPFSFDGKAGMWGKQVQRYETFNSIVTFPSSVPALVVNVGDPNNASYYYLVREEEGNAVAHYLGASSGGVSAQWIDPPDGGNPSPVDIALHRGRMEGGRWLLLGQYTVLDTLSLESTTFRQPEGFTPNQFKPPVAMAPDKGSFVRFGYATNASNAPTLAVFEIGTGTTCTLPIDRMRMHYNDWPEIDAAWLDRHYVWKAGADGRLHLLERKDFKPLPHCGSLTEDHGYREYKVSPVKPEMLDRVVAFLVERHQAELQPRGPHSGTDVLLIGQVKINVMFHGGAVMLWMDLGTDSRFVEELAAGFDEVLRTGELDDLFVLPGEGG